MALTPPEPADLEAFMHQTFSPSETEWAEADLQRATDLMHASTGLEEDPDDATALRIMKDGILDMAARLFVIGESRAEMYTPFSSERIGSYSYSKAMNAIANGESTGVELFDIAVRYLLGQAESTGDGVVRYDTEVVFERKDNEPALKDITDSETSALIDFFGR